MTQPMLDVLTADEDYDKVRVRIKECLVCPHRPMVNQTVPGWGSLEPRILVLGQAPSNKEGKRGEAMSSKTGKFIREWFYQLLGLSDNQVYWGNIVCCPPPVDEESGEIPEWQVKNCSLHLEALIDSLRPKLIVGMGNKVRQRMMQPKHMVYQRKGGISFTDVRLRTLDYRRYPLILITNPAVVRHKVGFERENFEDDVKQDFRYLKKVIDELGVLTIRASKPKKLSKFIARRKDNVRPIEKRSG